MDLQTLYPAVLRVAIILIAARVLLVLANVCDRRLGRASRELPRKLLHVGMGIIALAYPWLFDRAWPVLFLSTTFTGLLLARHIFTPLQYHVSGVIYGVNRTSRGEYYFPIVTAALFFLAHGDSLLYTTPLSLLVFADTAAALVGSRYGRPGFAKSIEGSTAFFIIAFLCSQIALSLDPRIDRPAALIIALQIAIVATLLEAVCLQGLDNLVVPLTTFAMLTAMLQITGTQLGDLLLIELTLLTAGWLHAARHRSPRTNS